MGALNRVELIGNLGQDPELRYTPQGQPVCNLSLATTETWKDKQGEKQEHTEWHRIQVWGKLGEIAAQYLKKGRQVYIAGSIRSREYVDKEGQKRRAYEIRAREMVMLNSGGGPQGAPGAAPAAGARPGGYQPRPPAKQAQPGDFGGMPGDDDIPF